MHVNNDFHNKPTFERLVVYMNILTWLYYVKHVFKNGWFKCQLNIHNNNGVMTGLVSKGQRARCISYGSGSWEFGQSCDVKRKVVGEQRGLVYLVGLERGDLVPTTSAR